MTTEHETIFQQNYQKWGFGIGGLDVSCYCSLMARLERIHLLGGMYHVILRGNSGMDIFTSDEDRCRFLFLLQEGSNRFDFRVHAFCLMGNHVHLAIQVSDVPLSKIMQNLLVRYIHLNPVRGP